jgi:hypothetical protein
VDAAVIAGQLITMSGIAGQPFTGAASLATTAGALKVLLTGLGAPVQRVGAVAVTARYLPP